MTESKIKVAKITLRGNTEKTYSFLTDIELEPGDLVICDTANTPSVGKVATISADLDPMATAWIIARIDYKAFRGALDRLNARVAEERKRREEQELDDLLG